MLDFLLHPVFILGYCAIAFCAGMHVAERSYKRYRNERSWDLADQYRRLMSALEVSKAKGE